MRGCSAPSGVMRVYGERLSSGRAVVVVAWWENNIIESSMSRAKVLHGFKRVLIIVRGKTKCQFWCLNLRSLLICIFIIVMVG